jgi:hypothetical protein
MFMKKFLRWVVNDCSRRSKSIERDVDLVMWLLLQRDDLPRAVPPSATVSSENTAASGRSTASAHASPTPHPFTELAPHPHIMVLRVLYYTCACDTFTLDDSQEVSVRPSVLLAFRRGCHDEVSISYSSVCTRVCVGRLLEALMTWGNRSVVKLDDDDESHWHNSTLTDETPFPWYPAPILPLTACHHPSSTLELLRHLITRLDMNRLAASALPEYARPPAPIGGWMPEVLVASGVSGSVDRDWLAEQQELLVQIVECVAAAAVRLAPFSGGQAWLHSSTSVAASCAAASCVSYLSSLTCGNVRLDCSIPCSLDACDVTARVLLAMKQPLQPPEIETITAHALLPLYMALLYQGPLALALRSVAGVQLLRLSQHIRTMSHFQWLATFSAKLLAHFSSRDDLCSAAPLLSCACVATAVIQQCHKVQTPASVVQILPKMADSSVISHRLNAIACMTALVDAGFISNLSALSSLSSSSSVLEAAVVAPWGANAHLFADAPSLQRPLADPSHHACLAVAKLYKAIFACKKYLKSSPRMQASFTRSFHEFFRLYVLRPSVPLQLLSYVITCIYYEGGERVRCMLEGQCDIVAGCGMRRMLLLCDGFFCRWPILNGCDGGPKELLPDECTQLLAKLRSASPLETIGINIVCRCLLQTVDAEQRAMLLLSEALNDGLSQSFEAIAQLMRDYVDEGDVAFRNIALRMCVNVMMVERDTVNRRAVASSISGGGSSSSGSSSTIIPRTPLVASIMALSNSASVRGALEW